MPFETWEVDLQSLVELRAGKLSQSDNEFRFVFKLAKSFALMLFEISEVDLQSFVGIAGRETSAV